MKLIEVLKTQEAILNLGYDGTPESINIEHEYSPNAEILDMLSVTLEIRQGHPGFKLMFLTYQDHDEFKKVLSKVFDSFLLGHFMELVYEFPFGVKNDVDSSDVEKEINDFEKFCLKKLKHTNKILIGTGRCNSNGYSTAILCIDK